MRSNPFHKTLVSVENIALFIFSNRLVGNVPSAVVNTIGSYINTVQSIPQNPVFLHSKTLLSKQNMEVTDMLKFKDKKGRPFHDTP